MLGLCPAHSPACKNQPFASQGRSCFASMLAQALFRKGQLKALVDIHSAQSGMGGYLTPDEVLFLHLCQTSTCICVTYLLDA